MHHFQKSAAMFAFLALSACDVSGLSSQNYPDRSQHSFQSADGVNVMTYACVNGANAASAHRYVDSAIRSATRRITGEDRYGQQLIGANWATRADVNAEIARISREAEAEYRCLLISRKDPKFRSPFGTNAGG